MSQKKPEQEGYGQLRERLKSGSLTGDDIKRLEELLSRSEGRTDDSGALGTLGGRPIIARLPGGLDVVK